MQKIRLYSSKRIYVTAVLFSILCSLFIFCMSHEPAIVSAERSGGIADVIAPIIIDDFDEMSIAEKNEILSDIDHIVRKIAHFCIYTVLGGLFTVSSLWHSRSWIMHAVLPFAFGALYAASDEFHQIFIPGRGPLVSDVLLDSAGVLCGITVVILVSFRIHRKI